MNKVVGFEAEDLVGDSCANIEGFDEAAGDRRKDDGGFAGRWGEREFEVEAGVPRDDADVDLVVARPADGGDGCTLLANELLVGAKTLLLNPERVLVKGDAIPSDVSARPVGVDRSKWNPDDILHTAEAGEALPVVFKLAMSPGVGCGIAVLRDALRSRRSGLRRWKPRLVSGLAGKPSKAIKSVRGLCGGDANRFFLADRAFDVSNTPDRRRPSDDRLSCGGAYVADGVMAAIAAVL